MPRRTAWLHVGLPGPAADAVATHQLHEAAALAEQGLIVVARDRAETRAAAHELRRDAREHGLRRRDVEGSWAALCRRAHKASGHVVLSEGRLASCTVEQAALLLDGLAPLRVRVLVTVPADELAGDVANRWRRAGAHSVDQVALPAGPRGAGEAWSAWCAAVGVVPDAWAARRLSPTG